MINYEELIKVLGKDIEFTPERLAALFCDLDSIAMAKFLNKVGEISDQWSGSFSMQMQYVKDSEFLTSNGRAIMNIIGEYGND